MVAALAMLWSVGAFPEQWPRIALVIDDLGFRPIEDRAVLALDARIAVAIIPEAPLAALLAQEAGDQQREVLVHLPLAGAAGDDCQSGLPCPDSDWPVARLTEFISLAFDRVHNASGLSNHQGSAYTADLHATSNLVSAIDQVRRDRARPLFVLDSRTTPYSALEREARRVGLPSARRHVFLDHETDPDSISAAFENLLEIARQRGSAIAIGHPHPQTVAFLEAAIPELQRRGIELVPLSSLMQRDDESTPGSSGATTPAAR